MNLKWWTWDILEWFSSRILCASLNSFLKEVLREDLLGKKTVCYEICKRANVYAHSMVEAGGVYDS